MQRERESEKKSGAWRFCGRDGKINRHASIHGHAQARCECIGRTVVNGCKFFLKIRYVIKCLYQ